MLPFYFLLFTRFALCVLPFELFGGEDNSLLAEEGDPDIRLPLRLRRPPHHQSGGAPSDILAYANTMVWYHFYPEIQGYERPGNGYTGGDEGLFEICASTYGDGGGSLLIEFPAIKDPVNLIDGDPRNGHVDGLSHERNIFKVQGFRAVVWPLVGDVSFREPHSLPYVSFTIPHERSYKGFYLPFWSVPDAEICFALKRFVIWDPPYWSDADVPPPPAPTTTKDEL